MLVKNEIETELDRHILDFEFIDKGYAWIFPYENYLRVCVGRLEKDRMRKIFEEFLRVKSLENEVEQVSGSPIPFECFLPEPVFENILLIVHAAVFMNSLPGEGIYYAHKSAELAASSIILHNRDNSVDLGQIYSKRVKKEILPEFERMMIMREFLWSIDGRIQRLLMDIFSSLFGRG